MLCGIKGDASGLDFSGSGVTLKQEHGHYGTQQIGQQQQIVQIGDRMMEEEGILTHDFEFLNLEFVKPTRWSTTNP